MAATKKGPWSLQEVRDKQLQDEWSYFAPDAPGQLWTWGDNEDGQLGLNQQYNFGDSSSPKQVGTQETWMYVALQGSSKAPALGVKNDGTLWIWGYNDKGSAGTNHDNREYSSPTQIPGTSWSQEAGKTAYKRVITTKTDGSLWAWGYNQNGELGQNQSGTPAPDAVWRSSPTQIGTGTDWDYGIRKSTTGSYTSYAIKTNGTLWGWGSGSYGKLGQNDNTGRSSPVQIGTETTWARIDAARFCLATKTDGTLWGWGLNDDGQCGSNNQTRYSSPRQVGTNTTWHDVCTTNGGAMATKTDGTLWSWGYNFFATYGHSRTKHSSPIQIPGTWNKDECAIGGGSASGIKDDGTFWKWGRNFRGSLGLGDNTSYSSPMQVGTDKSTWLKNGGMGSYYSAAILG